MSLRNFKVGPKLILVTVLIFCTWCFMVYYSGKHGYSNPKQMKAGIPHTEEPLLHVNPGRRPPGPEGN